MIGALGIRNKHGVIAAEECASGQLVGTGRELADASPAG